MPAVAPLSAASRSASANTMFGDLPPSSSVSFFIVSAAVFIRCLPTSVEPVNEILSMPGCFTIASPAMDPLPGRMLSGPGAPGVVLREHVAEPDQQVLALGRLQLRPRPRFERGARGLHRAIAALDTRLGDHADRLLGRRVHRRVGLARGGVHRLAIDD